MEVVPVQYKPGQQDDCLRENNQSDHTEPGVIVDVQYLPEEDVKTYNVHRKTGDFVIGEAGKIDLHNGQTFEVTLLLLWNN